MALMNANEHETRSNNQKNRVFCLRYMDVCILKIRVISERRLCRCMLLLSSP